MGAQTPNKRDQISRFWILIKHTQKMTSTPYTKWNKYNASTQNKINKYKVLRKRKIKTSRNRKIKTSKFNICLFAEVGRAVTFTFSSFKSLQLSSDFSYPVISLVASLQSESDAILHDDCTLLFQCANLHTLRTWVNRKQLENKLLLERIQNNSIIRISYCSRSTLLRTAKH